MSQADELLAKLAESPSDHFHSVVDDDNYFVIDPNTRKIENKSGRINYIMQKDHKSEIYTIELPRIVEGHDMTLCNKVYVHFLNVDNETQEERYDFAETTDLRVPSDNPDVVLCTWIIERHATQLIGSLAFLIHYECVADDGTVDYEFHSDWYSDVVVKKGRHDKDPVILQYTNLLEQWERRIFGAGEGLLDGIEAAKAEAVETVNSTASDRKAEVEAAIQAKGKETLDSIPADYTETYRMAEEALRTKADAIVVKAEGNPIVINDASDDHLLGLKVFGKTEQASESTPGNPQELVSIENPKVYIYGRNLLASSAESMDKNGLSFIVNEDGSVTVTGTATSATTLYLTTTTEFQAGNYILTGCPAGGADTKYDLRLGSYRDYGEGKSFVLDEPTTEAAAIMIRSGVTVDNLTFYPMLQFSDNASDEYESYRGQDLSIQRTLRSVGDVRDELVYDFQTNTWQLIQRVAHLALTGENNWDNYTYANDVFGFCVPHVLDTSYYRLPGLSNQFSNFGIDDYAGRGKYTLWLGVSNDYLYVISRDLYDAGLDAWKAHLNENPLEIVYPLATPIIHELTTEEVLAFKALHTNKTNTVIQNGVGADMEVKYSADTKTFITNIIRSAILEALAE